MSRLLAVVLSTALGLTSVAAVPADAAALSCRGLPATIVGMPGADLTGTPGPDVVVTNGARSVDTGGGDDLVCASGTPTSSESFDSQLRVDVGAGVDTVDTTADGAGVDIATTLGEGDDVFEGGRARDHVDARDAGHDTVRTGGGNDSVNTGSATGLDQDDIDTGASGDALGTIGRLGPAALLSGGDGRDNLFASVPSGGRWVFDNRSKKVRHDGVTAWRWSGVEGFFFAQIETIGQVSFIGGPDDELLYVTTSAFAGARLGGGNDEALLASPRLAGTPAIGAGAGRDSLQLLPYGTGPAVARAELDLGSGSLGYTDRKGRRTSMDVTGFELADVYARAARMGGSAADDTLTAWACDVRMSRSRGQDRLEVVPVEACAATARRAIFGGPGDDRLTGSPYADVLVGGPGTDRADGFLGRDRCDAETEKRCE